LRRILLSRETAVYGRTIYLQARRLGVPFDAVLLEYPPEWGLRARLAHHLRARTLFSAAWRAVRRRLRSLAVRCGLARREEPSGNLVLASGETTYNLLELARRDGIEIRRTSDHNSPEAVAQLRNLKKPNGLQDRLVEVHRLENLGDDNNHAAIAELYDTATDPILVMKWKEIYDTLEKTLDHMEDAGNVLESISIKHA